MSNACPDLHTPVRRVRPSRIGIVVRDRAWVPGVEPFEVVAVADLRELSRKARQMRLTDPTVDLLVPIDVALADEPSVARTSMSAAGQRSGPPAMTYVGTPRGLAGLIADIRALELAEGALLRPVGPESLFAICRNVLPDMGIELPSDVEERLDDWTRPPASVGATGQRRDGVTTVHPW